MRSAQRRGAGRVAIGRLIDTFYQITCLLKLNRDVKSGRHVDALRCNAGCVRTARRDLVSPEVETVCIRLPTKEVEVVLSNEKLGVVYGIRENTATGVDENGNIVRTKVGDSQIILIVAVEVAHYDGNRLCPNREVSRRRKSACSISQKN